MRRQIAGQVVVITGASSGIGRCTAEYLASQGARVVVTARRAEVLDDLVGQIESKGGDAVAVPGDITLKDDLRAVAKAAVDRFGRVDTWVNNAGVYIQGRIQDITLEEFRRVLDVNVVGTINGTQAALEVMLPQGSGVIVQVSSIAGRRGVPYTTPYSASKSALDGFTEALRAELWGSGVHFSIVYPQTVDTPIFQQSRGKLGVVPKPAAPMATPLRVARAIARLAQTGERHLYFGWAGPLAKLNALSPAAADWLLHHTQGFTYSDLRAGEDNLYEPSTTVPPTVRGGWSDPGWKGLTVREAVQVLPLESLTTAAALGFLLARLTRKSR